MPTFTPPRAPSQSSSFNETPQVYEANFGDGYSQTAAKGINNIERTCTLEWNALTTTELDDLQTFFDDLYGVETFDYQIPGDATSRTWREVSGSRSRSTASGSLWTFRVGLREVR
jgi:phage-related protein